MTDEGRYYPKGTDETYALDKSEIVYPFFPVVGNHDITHNGWAMWSSIFHSSFYEFIVFVIIDGKTYYDRHIFLDTASGTLGSTQVDLIEAGALDANNHGMEYRHTFVYACLQSPRFIARCSEECHPEGQYVIYHQQRQVATDKYSHSFSIVAAEEVDYGSQQLFAQQYCADEQQQAQSSFKRQ